MVISWYGQRCIKIEAKEGTVLIDPFDARRSGDLVLFSAQEQPKGVLEKVSEGAFVITGPGEYEQKGIAVRGILAYQDSQKGAELGLATLYTVTAEEMTVCHLGALGQEKLTEEQLEAIGDPDVLIIPAGGQSALDPKAAAALAMLIEPKIIIPMQFGGPDTLPLGKFSKELGLQAEDVDALRITKKQLPVDTTKLIVLAA